MKPARTLIVFALCTTGALALVSFVLPSSWEVAREIQIHAGAGEVHRVVADLETWAHWFPWGRSVDPGVKMDVGAPARGNGARLAWNGPQVGDGSLEVSFEDPAKGLWFGLARRGDRERIKGVFQYEELDGSSTMVKWTLRSEVGFDPIERYVALMRTYTMGPDLVDALERLKRQVESSSY
jgi:uncharacterized membrane protein